MSPDGRTCHGPAKHPQHLPYHPHGEFMEGSTVPFLDPTEGTRGRAKRRLPQRKQGPALLTCQEFGLGIPRKGGRLHL